MTAFTENDLKRLEDLIISGQKAIETRLTSLESGQKAIETRLTSLESGQKVIENSVGQIGISIVTAFVGGAIGWLIRGK
jgi:hypothetical protein